ncbi:hypothetical protein C8R44DRAFT_847143, partial [Mycena epipterygia]
MSSPALRHVNGLGPHIPRPNRPVPTLTRKRRYALSALEPQFTPKPAATKKMRAVLPLPAAPQEPFTAPLVESDFQEYLKPLYSRGWSFHLSTMPVEPGEETSRAGFSLRRDFRFPSIKDMSAFSENTRNVSSGNVSCLYISVDVYSFLKLAMRLLPRFRCIKPH